MTTPWTPKRQRRKILVAFLLPIAILGITAGALFASIRYGIFTRQLLRENERATQILLEKVELIHLYTWNEVTSTNGFIPFTFTEVSDPSATGTAQGLTYSGTVSIATCAGASSYTNDLRQLTVSLNWMSRGIPHTRSLTTNITKAGASTGPSYVFY